MTTPGKPPRPAPAPKTTREKAADAAERALDTTRDSAREIARRTAEGIEANPLSVLVGGVALGVLAGAFIPRSEQEEKVLGPLGKSLTDKARGAVDAARNAGKSEFDLLGLSRNAARDQVIKMAEGVFKAIASASAAAASSGKRANGPAGDE